MPDIFPHLGRWLPHALLMVLAVVCLSHLGYRQVQMYNRLGEELSQLQVYRAPLARVSAWAEQSQVSRIGYLQTAPSEKAGGAKKTMTRYLLAPLILEEPTTGRILINFSSESQQRAFEQSQHCHAVIQFGQGVALMEKNR